jgi:hypothetical protein
MTTVLVIVVLLVLVAVAALWWTRRSAATKDDRALSGPVDPLADGPGGPLDGLGVGAVVSHGGHDYVVRGEIRFDEDGYVWTEYHLDAGRDVRTWLSVDVSDGTEVAFWQAVEAPGDLAPDGATVTHDGVPYRRVESGEARFTSSGTTGLPASGRAAYVDYKGDGDRLLSFERWSASGSWEVSTGTEIEAHLLEVYPAGRTAGGTL